MRSRTRVAVLGGVVVVALLTAWYAGSRFAPSAPGPSAGTVRLGPDAGEPVAAYLARLPAELPPPGAPAYALVQLSGELTGPDAVAAVAGTDPVSVVFRVPIPRVQTALRFADLGSAPPAQAVETARSRAQAAAEGAAARAEGRPRAVAAAEAAALADPACACVVALVVRGERAALESLAASPQVRAVHAAPPDAQPAELALSPLLPEQTEAALPVPDDGDP